MENPTVNSTFNHVKPCLLLFHKHLSQTRLLVGFFRIYQKREDEKCEMEILTHLASDVLYFWVKPAPVSQRLIRHFRNWLQADSQPISLFILNLLSVFDHLLCQVLYIYYH